jgi:SAM-dependent methyltransferase
MLTTPKNEKLFWRHKARQYPMPFDPATFRKTSRIIALAEKLGADFRGRDLLDIGCGTGIYALVLLGVDSSGPMLRRFRAEAGKRGIKNVRTLKSVWGKVETARVAKNFDIALASMTHAVIDLHTLKKMEAAARELCVYIGWAGVRKNPFLERIYSHHGIKYSAPEGAGEIVPLLKKLGRKFKVIYFKDSWQWKGKPGEALKDIKVSLKINAAKPDRLWVNRFLNSRTKNGILTHATTARKGLVVWRPGNMQAAQSPKAAKRRT